MYKYPRTRHLEGSREQPGDEDLESVPIAHLAGRSLVIEEKVDGANAGISFDSRGNLRLQSRGHFLTGGRRERHFDLFKQWANANTMTLHAALGDRYVLYGEWLYAKHTIFYDALPAYFMEFDALDTASGDFLDTPRRAALLDGVGVASVRVLHAGTIASRGECEAFIGDSTFIRPGHRERLVAECERRGLDVERCLRETDPMRTMEGLYVKVEEDGVVKERYKFVRASFLTAVQQAEGHWLNRPIIPNGLAGDSIAGAGG